MDIWSWSFSWSLPTGTLTGCFENGTQIGREGYGTKLLGELGSFRATLTLVPGDFLLAFVGFAASHV